MRHVGERGYPAACKQSETRGGEFEGLGYAERDHGVSLTLEGNDNSPLILSENVASDVTPTGDNDAVTVIFYEIGGKALAEEWEREASKLFPHDRLSSRGRGLHRLRHRGRPPHPTYAPRAEAATAIARAYVK